MFDFAAQGYAGQKNVLHFAQGLSGGSVRELADRIGKQCTGIAAVFSGDDENGYQMCLVSASEDVRPLGQQAAKQLAGRGGGKPGAFQGSVKATKTQIEEFMQTALA